MSATLKPCPFCGETIGFGGNGHREDCYLMLMHTRPRLRIAEYIAEHAAQLDAAWNTRAQSALETAAARMAEALERAIADELGDNWKGAAQQALAGFRGLRKGEG